MSAYKNKPSCNDERDGILYSMQTIFPTDCMISESILNSYSSRTLANRAVPYIFIMAILGIFSPFYVDLPVDITVRRVALLLSILILAAVLIRSGRVVLSSGEGAMVFLYILLLGSIAWAYAPLESVNRVFDLGFLGAFYVLFVTSGTNRIQDWWRALVLYSLFVTVLTVVYSVIGYQFGDAVTQNTVSRFTIASIPILTFAAGDADRRKFRAGLLSCAGLNSLLVVTLRSRSGFIALCVVLSLLGLYGGKLLHDRSISFGPSIAVGLLIGMLGTILYLSTVVELLEQFPRSLSAVTPEMIGVDRYTMYSLVIDVLRDNWVFGIGYGSFPVVMAEVHRKGFIIHGFILRLWVGAGILAVILILYVILCAIRGYTVKSSENAYQSSADKREIALCIALCGFITIGLFNPVFTNPLFVLLLALGTGTFKDFKAG